MKIKIDYVTNSSSTAYLVVGYEVGTGKDWGSLEDDYYDDVKLEEELTKKFNLPKEFGVFDLHYGTALAGIVFTGYEELSSITLSKVLDNIDKLKEIAKRNEWKGEPKMFAGSRSSEG